MSPASSRFSRFAPRPSGDHVRVLDEEQRVGDLAALARRDQLELHRPHVAERARAEVDDACFVFQRF